jgi:uncharacterized membrane protein YqjE
MWKLLMEIAAGAMTGKDTGSLSPLQLLQMLRSAGGALFAQASLHAQLAQVEWEEEKQRLCRVAMFGVLGFAFALCFLIAVSAFAIALSWNTPYRIHTFTAVIVVHMLGFIGTALAIKKLIALGSKSFAATRAEIASDIALLKSAL